MNKFAAIALLAFVAVAAAYETADTESQAALQTTDAEEIANLPEDQMAFADYCKSSRDYVLSEIRMSANSLSSKVFAMFFNSAEALGQEAGATLDKANSRLSEQLRNPSAEIAPASDETEQILADAQARIAAGESQPGALLTGFKAAVGAVSQNVAKFVQNKIESIKQFATVDQVVKALVEACSAVTEYEAAISSQFTEAKSALQGVDNVTFDNVKCVTARRISRIEGLCRLSKVASPVVPKLFSGLRKN